MVIDEKDKELIFKVINSYISECAGRYNECRNQLKKKPDDDEWKELVCYWENEMYGAARLKNKYFEIK